MRISDWSSDVCSSDLSDRAAVAPSGPARPVGEVALASTRSERRFEECHNGPIEVLVKGDAVELGGVLAELRRAKETARHQERIMGRARHIVEARRVWQQSPPGSGVRRIRPDLIAHGRSACRDKVVRY